MSKRAKRTDRGRRTCPEGWIVMTVGKPAPPGVRVGKKCVLPYEQIKHWLSDRPIPRHGGPALATPKIGKRHRVSWRPGGSVDHECPDGLCQTYPDDWVVMHIGKRAPPGTPVGTLSWPTYEEVKDRLKDLPMLRPGELHDWMQRTNKRERAKRRRA